MIKKTFWVILFILVMIICDGRQGFEEIVNNGTRIGHKLIFCFLYGLIIISLVFLFGIKNKKFHIPFLVILTLSMTIFFGSKLIHGQNFGAHDALIMSRENGFALEFFFRYWRQIILGLFLGVLIPWVLNLLVTKKIFNKNRTTNKILIPIPLFIIIINYLIFHFSEMKYTFVPSYLRVPFFSIYVFYKNKSYQSIEKRMPIKIDMDKNNKNMDHIVFIIDESIRGDLLAINGYSKDTTPFLSSLKRNIYNFGVAISSFNSSWYSVSSILVGMTDEDLRLNHSLFYLKPTLYDYSSLAGYKNFYIDGQAATRQYSMLENDFRKTKKISMAKGVGWKRDFDALKTLKDILNENKKTFSILIKMGAHSPFFNKYPKNTFKNVAMNGNENENHYYNAIRWTTDTFLKEVHSLVEKYENLIIVYTSDHGEEFDEGFAKGRSFHMINKNYYKVPFIVLTRNKYWGKKLKFNLNKNINRVHHLNVFPSLLKLMGLNEDEIYSHYGYNIFTVLPNKRFYYRENKNINIATSHLF